MLRFQKKNVETDRLILQPYIIKFYKDVYQLIHRNKDRLTHSFPNLLRATETEAATKDYVQQKIFDWNNNKAYGFMIFDKSTHQLIGHFNLKDIDWKKRICELAYFIDDSYAQQGLVTEAMNALLDKCFREIQLEHVMARIVTTNIASQKVVEKAGLKYEGAYYQAYTTYDNKVVDTYRYGISKEDFARKSA